MSLCAMIDPFHIPVHRLEIPATACSGSRHNGTHSATIDINTLLLLLFFTDPSNIQAPAQQYALLHSNTTLNCTTTFSETSVINIRWMRNASNPVNDQIINVNLTHEGNYMCEVYVGVLDLTMKKNVTFYVIGEW